MNTISDMYRGAMWAAWVALAGNLALALVKLVGGIVGGSIALAADAMNSVGDAFMSAVIIYALHVARKPPDEEHPYGHSRAEGVAAISVACVIGAGAIAFAVEALRNFGKPHDVPPVWTLWIAAGNVIVKEAMYRYQILVAQRTGSQALIAGAWDHRSDAFCSAAVLVGLAVVRYGGESFIWADEVAALIVVAFILYATLKLYRANASVLMDEQVDVEFEKQIREVASGVDGVARVETVRARRSGLEVFVDIHVEVQPDIPVDDAHRIGHDVQAQLIENIGPVTQVLVHIEPASE